jgi:hypothetical protein
MEAYLIEHPEERARYAGDSKKAWDWPEWSAIGGAVKALGSGTFEGFLVKYGSPEAHDISSMADWFHEGTDFWLPEWSSRPLLFHHAMDEGTSDEPIVGAVKIQRVPGGLWLQGQLDASHRYARQIEKLIADGKLKLSADSAPHLIQRTPTAGNTNRVDRFPIFAASLTVSPAEPRLPPVTPC